jgi:membrane protein YqaA with SNARE-associated domain
MTLAEKYWFLFVDTFFGNFIFSLQNEFAFSALATFGTSKNIVLLITLSAVMFSGIVNYVIGASIYNILIKYTAISKLRYQYFQQLFSQYHLLVFWLCFSGFFAKIFITLCGFLAFKMFRSLLLLMFFRVIYYYIMI